LNGGINTMSNTLGRLFTLTTAGESHGPAMTCIVDGCPPLLALSEADMQTDLDRRKPGQSKYVTQRHESDTVKILSGVFEGKTTGTSIALLIENEDQRSRNYDDIKDKMRPGHADYTYQKKYGIRDYRGGGRSSARETAMWVAVGAIAKKYLFEKTGLVIHAAVSAIGSISADKNDGFSAIDNDFNFMDASKITALETYIDQLRRDGDSCGAKIVISAQGVPVGLGDPIFNKLDANIAKVMMGINAVKAVEIGAGFLSVTQKGSEHRDEMNAHGFLTNDAGGILGGISTGADIDVTIAIKPTSSILKTGQTQDITGNETDISTTGRHDPCVGIRAVPIAEAVLAIVLMDAYLCQQAYKG
jgi:chorismate synthase